MIDERDRIVLRDLSRVAEVEGLSFFVIGAGARLLVHDWPFAIKGGRATTDWDIAVRMATWAEYYGLRTALTRAGSPFESTTVDHRPIHANGRGLDLVPFGGVETNDREVAYPQGGTRHSVLGLRECEACCTMVDIGDGVHVPVVGPPGLTLLKATAYLDRRPMQTHDIRDLDHLARTYGDALGDSTVIDRASEVLQEEIVVYEDVGAYLLGREVRALQVPGAVLEPLLALLSELMEPTSAAVDDLLTRDSGSEPALRDSIVRRYAAMRAGLGR